MAKSIMQTRKECYLCKKRKGLEEHHIFFGPRRKLSEEDGLKVYLCWEHHRGNNGAHLNRDLNLILKQQAQMKYEETHTREEFIKRYRRNYLDLD